MSVIKKNVRISIEEYLEGEKSAQVKHEYDEGTVYAMVGASRAHNTLALTLASRLRSELRGRACEVFMSDVKVRIGDIFYYPDVLVTCSKTDSDPYYCTEPILIIEVLSPATESIDRLGKRLAYQSLSSLNEYVLVSQDSTQVQAYRRAAANWDLETYGEGEIVRFASVQLEFPISEIYRDLVPKSQ
jgi:Uma2 family endonuclease